MWTRPKLQEVQTDGPHSAHVIPVTNLVQTLNLHAPQSHSAHLWVCASRHSPGFGYFWSLCSLLKQPGFCLAQQPSNNCPPEGFRVGSSRGAAVSSSAERSRSPARSVPPGGGGVASRPLPVFLGALLPRSSPCVTNGLSVTGGVRGG